jgi:DNA-binding beta-propeller fold protein YncE
MVVGVRGRTLQEINSNGTILGSTASGVGPTHIRSGPGDLFYIADTQGNRILVFRSGPKRPVPLGSVYTGSTPYGLAIDQRRDMLYVTLTGTNKLRSFRIQGHHLEPQRTWPTVRQPNDVAIDDATGTVIIAGAANSVLQFIAP